MAKKREENAEEFKAALSGHNIPILTLDVRWHTLFPDHEKTPKIKSLEKELNNLLKKQGKLSTDNKEMKKLKRRLMQEIVDNMEASEEGRGTKLQEKKVDMSQKMILEINDKMKEADKELLNIPNEIQRVNKELMAESLKVCYGKIEDNTDKLKELSKEADELREKLKYKLLEKQDREMVNDKIYTYMHAILGPGVMEILDRRKGIDRVAHRDMEIPENIPVPDDGDDDPDAPPVGTGNRIPKPRRGVLGDRDKALSGQGDAHLNKVRTKAQEESEKEKKRQNLVRELEYYDKQQEIKDKERARQQAGNENTESQENSRLSVEGTTDFMEERKQKLEERRAAIKKRKGKKA